MDTVYDGTKRSLTARIVWTVSGTTVSDKTYNGKTGSIYDNLNSQVIAAGGSGFTWNMINYPNLTGQQFAELDETTYQTRLAAFKAWVESLEPGYTFAANLDPAYPPTMTDEVECPPFIMGTTTTTTTTTTVP